MSSRWMAVAVFVCVGFGTTTNSDSVTAAEKFSRAEIEFFEREVRPLLIERCFECHSAEEHDGGLSLDSRAAILSGGDSGPAAVAKAPDQSLLLHAVRYQDQALQMPPQNRLDRSEIQVFEKWIQLGLPDPRSDSLVDVHVTTTDEQLIDPQADRFWAFQAPHAQSPPVMHDAQWLQSPIDRFILAKLEANGIKPSLKADKRVLIRRIYFDLIGLPPTEQQVQAFVEDPDDNAIEKLIDRLLASPSYGVRWGRHWLDVARYADSNGLDENLALGNAWRYRDYVIESFNADKPYDQFVIEQIAGDLVRGADQDTIAGTGFLALGAKVLAEPDREKLVMDTIDEQIDTLGKAFLGMTLGCARCHDHKFDPLTQKDYYALAAIFKSTKTFGNTNTGAIKHWYEHSIASPAELQKLVTIDADIAKAKQAATSFKNKHIAALRDKARENVADYLVAALQIQPSDSLTKIQSITSTLGLHPHILHHCRRHLQFHRADPLFERWHQFNQRSDQSSTDLEQLREYYRAAFASKSKSENRGGSDTIPESLFKAAQEALADTTGLIAVPAQPQFAFDSETLAEYNRLMEIARVLESKAPDEPALMGVSEQATMESVPIHIRGSHLNLGDEVKRELPDGLRVSRTRPIFPTTQSGRLQLAQWLADTRNPLTARVFVNRVWGWHFGQPLVMTTENFGLLGDRPSHPELLDWLAIEFMRSGWSVKKLHRLIMLSSTYQMRSEPAAEADISTDPENRLHSHANVQRLSAESIHDSIYFVTGGLDRQLDGKTVPLRNRQFVFDHTSIDHTKYDSHRRALYLPVIRNNVYSFFTQFDYPDPTTPTGHRQQSIVAPQALLMMNSPLVVQASEDWAEQLLASELSNQQRIASAYQVAFGRPPSETESARAMRFIKEASDSERQAWAMFCQSMLAANEFMYIR
ncbi:PSD1 and planctomycete cytochrome C domain-containing protein [Stieleria sp. JC731]|uniref:PSD1 and planctomycete cytochrome C domain-containing protein n=1 Tax=Pirellulaceae TaxID=2691357 RepID=UPI001E5643B0|nr:PSD1 and planctomycete cytochrome C domain-containing protein [Stieleria sp. JC731]MCC9603238.1 PSD1 and planctomycete cytochrome C domain-containing protein [Stieleria sp. JC731]